MMGWLWHLLFPGRFVRGPLLHRAARLLLTALVLAACTVRPAAPPAAPAALVWDSWQVPHIAAASVAEAFSALGWAQMHNRGDLILRLYAQARGRGAEFYGPDFRAADETVLLLDIPARGSAWYAAQSPTFRSDVDAFAAGLNAYAAAHPNRFAAGRALLPITGEDVFRHLARLMALLAAANSECAAVLPGLDLDIRETATAWALAPAHTADGNAMLLGAPNFPWQDATTLFEAQIVAPGVDLYGAAFVGLPVLAFGFNPNLAWTHTLSPADLCDLYQLTFAGAALDDGYRLDGEVQAFATFTATLKVKQPDGAVTVEPLVIRRAAQGPVVLRRGQPLAVRLAGQDALPVPGLAEQWWDMGRASTWEEFRAALDRQPFPVFNTVYADRTGHIAAQTAANLPHRIPDAAEFWQLPVPGDQSTLIWTAADSAADLPRVVDPDSGWLQSSGGVPWTFTLPPLDPTGYPATLAPAAMTDAGQFLRDQKSLKTLRGQEAFTFDALVAAGLSTRSELADRILDAVIAAARRDGDPTAVAAADVLAAWDRQADPDSRGMALFALWYTDWVHQSMAKLLQANPMGELTPALKGSALFYATPWDPQDPLDTPQGLFGTLMAVRALVTASQTLTELGLPLDATWGDLARFRGDGLDLPAAGGSGDLGMLRAMDFQPDADGRLVAEGGPAFVMAVEFGSPIRAQVLLPTGNADTDDGEQLKLTAAGALRPALLTRAEVEADRRARPVPPQ